MNKIILRICLFALIGYGSVSAQTIPQHSTLLSNEDAPTRILLEGHFQKSYGRLSEQNKRSVFVLRNSFTQPIAGYVIKWTVDSAGQKSSLYQAFDETELLAKPHRSVSGFGLEPGMVRLVTLYGNFHEARVKDEVGGGHMVELSVNHPIARRLGNSSKSLAELDSVIYADGTFEGQDDADLVQSFLLERNAKHDAGAAVLLALQKGETEQQVTAHLESEKSKGDGNSSVRGKGGYIQARARWAETLLLIYKHGGLTALTNNASEFTRLTHVGLMRMSGPPT